VKCRAKRLAEKNRIKPLKSRGLLGSFCKILVSTFSRDCASDQDVYPATFTMLVNKVLFHATRISD